MKKIVLFVMSVVISLPALAARPAPYTPTLDNVSDYLSMNSRIQACAPLGYAAVMVARFAWEMGMNNPDDADLMQKSLQRYFEKDDPLGKGVAKDIAEYTYLLGVTYIAHNADLIRVILNATAEAQNRKEATLLAHQAIASPCAATNSIRTASGSVSRSMALEGMLSAFKNRAGQAQDSDG